MRLLLKILIMQFDLYMQFEKNRLRENLVKYFSFLYIMLI